MTTNQTVTTNFPLANKVKAKRSQSAAPKAPAVLIVQGTKVNSKIIAAYATRVESIDALLSVWANAATIQLAKYANRNWLDTLFNLPTLRLKSGELSKTGKDVLSYITSHCPRVVWNKENKTIGCLPYVEAELLATNFIAFGATEASDTNVPEEIAVTKIRGKFYRQIGDFHMTLNEFRNFQKVTVVKAPSDPSMTVKAFNNNCDKASAFMADAKFFGTAEELSAAKAKLENMLKMVERLAEGLPAVEPEAPVSVDTADIDPLITADRLAPTVTKKEAK